MSNHEKQIQDLTSEIVENFPAIDQPIALRIAQWLIGRQADELRARALERANQDAKSVNEYAWYIVNSLIIVNGAAITAVLAGLGTGRVFTSINGIRLSAFSQLCFSVGIFLSIFAAIQQRKTIAGWRDIWEERARGGVWKEHPSGRGPGKAARILMGVSCIAFVVGAAAVSAGIIYSGLKVSP